MADQIPLRPVPRSAQRRAAYYSSAAAAQRHSRYGQGRRAGQPLPLSFPSPSPVPSRGRGGVRPSPSPAALRRSRTARPLRGEGGKGRRPRRGWRRGCRQSPAPAGLRGGGRFSRAAVSPRRGWGRDGLRWRREDAQGALGPAAPGGGPRPRVRPSLSRPRRPQLRATRLPRQEFT